MSSISPIEGTRGHKSVPTILNETVVCQRARKEDMGVWKARMAREEGERGMPLSSLLPRPRSRA